MTTPAADSIVNVTPTPVPAAPLQHAQPSVPNPDETFTAQQVRTMIEKARSDEKDKLYPRLSATDERTQALQAELDELKSAKQAADEADARRDAEAAAVKKAAAEAELSARELAETVRREAQEEVTTLRAEMEKERALAAKEREYSRIELYKQKRIDAERDNIEPHLIRFVTGHTEQEIEASIASLKEASTGILETVKQVQTNGRAQMQGVAPTAGNTGAIDGEGQPREVTAEDIMAMDGDQYAAYRQQAGIAQQSPNWFGSSYNDRIGR
jgi:hypothetical protein